MTSRLKSFRLPTRTPSRQKERQAAPTPPQDRKEGPPTTVSMAGAASTRSRRARSGRDLTKGEGDGQNTGRGATATATGTSRRRLQNGGMAAAAGPRPQHSSRGVTAGRRRKMSAEERPSNASRGPSSRHVASTSREDGGASGRPRGARAEDSALRSSARSSNSANFKYGFGEESDDDGESRRTAPSLPSSRRPTQHEQYQRQEPSQRRIRPAGAGVSAAGEPEGRLSKEVEKEYSSALRSRLEQVKQHRRVPPAQQRGRVQGPQVGTGSSSSDPTLVGRSGSSRRLLSRERSGRLDRSNSGGIGSRPPSADGRPGSRTRSGRRPSGGIQKEAASRTAQILQQPRRRSLNGGNSSSRLSYDDEYDVPQPTNQLAQARKAVEDVEQEREEMRVRIADLQEELRALDMLYEENVSFLKKLENGAAPKDATSIGNTIKGPPPSGKACHLNQDTSSTNQKPSPPEASQDKEKAKSGNGRRKLSWKDDEMSDDENEPSRSERNSPRPAATAQTTKRAADLSPEQIKSLNKAKLAATQSVIKNTSMDEGEKRKKIQTVNKIATSESLEVDEKISMLNDIVAGKKPREPSSSTEADAKPETKPQPKPKSKSKPKQNPKSESKRKPRTKPKASAPSPAKKETKKAADLSPEQIKALNKAKMIATQTVIRNAAADEGGKRKKIQNINKINSDESLDVDERIRMLNEIADGKEPTPPVAAKPPSKKKAPGKKGATPVQLSLEQTKELNKCKMLAIQTIIKNSKLAEDEKRKRIQIVNSIMSHEYLEFSEKVSRLQDVQDGKEVKDPNDDDEGSLDFGDLISDDEASLGTAATIEVEGEIVSREHVARIRNINNSLGKSMHISMSSKINDQSPAQMWMSSFRRLDPRYKILSFFRDVAEQGVDRLIKSDKSTKIKQTPALLSWINRAGAFSVWRPTSRDAIHKMMSGQASGKGLEIKGKSAKCGCLSALVPFIQIYEEQHKERIRECVRDKTMCVFFPTQAARDEAADMLNDVVEMMMFFVQDAMQMLANPDITEEQEKEVMKHLQWDGSDLGVVKLNDYAPQCWGVKISERLFWEGFVMMQDCSRPPGSKFETGRPSEPAFMDMNFKAVRHVPSEPGEPVPVVYQTDPEYPMSPRTLVVAYEETGRVLPVVSDFDCFTVGTRGVKFDQPLPPDQVELVKWTVTNIESVLDQPFSADTWTKRWLEILKQAAIKGFYPKMPRFGFGDPKSYALMGKAVECLQDTGAVRHGAECFNYFFPQDLDDEFLIVSDSLPGVEDGAVPWKYVGVEELQEFLLQKADEGFTFPLNPKWVLCDPGWKRIYDTLMKSEKRHVQDALNVWFPPESGIREHIERVYKNHPKGFVRDVGGDSEEDDEMDDMAAAELELERFMNLESAKKKIRAVSLMIALSNTLPSAVAKNRREKLQRGGSYRAPSAPSREARRDAAMHRAMQLQEAAANRDIQ